MSGRRLDVTATQAVSSLLATLTGAIAASGLGIAGTIIGAAFMSLASTVGAAVYKHYLARSHERLRTVAANLAPRANGNAVAAAVVRRHLAHDPDETAPVSHNNQPSAAHASAAHASAAQADDTEADDTEQVGPTRNIAGSAATTPDLTETEVIPTLAGLSHGWQRAHEDAATHAGGLDDPGGPDSTRNLAPAGQTEVGPAPAGQTGVFSPAENPAALAAGDSRRARNGWQGARRRWLALAAVALGVFVAGMGTITAFEAIAGKPLEAVVWHRSGSGTTIGGLVKHSPSHQRHSQPARNPSPATSPTSPASSHPSTTPTPQPTTSVSPAPTHTAPTSAASSAAAGT
jgi:hypothetical protein